jgi:hypothetical protein
MNKRDLLKKKNVILVYPGKKVVGGVATGRDSLRVGVITKVPLAQLEKKDVIPTRVKGVETDVFVTDEIMALAVDRKAKHRPAPGGVSIGHPKVTAGTMGMVVRKGGFRHILSNNHVLANCNGASVKDPILQPGVADGGTLDDIIAHLSDFMPITFGGGCSKVGSLVYFIKRLFEGDLRLSAILSTVNKVDCAIARPVLDGDVSSNIMEIGIPVGFAEAKTGDTVKKSGRTTGLNTGSVISTEATARVNYGDKGEAVFEDQVITSCMSAGGDSGSVVLDQQNRAVGLLFAGSSTITIINKIYNVIEALGLDETC